jgi:hypothetical protein
MSLGVLAQSITPAVRRGEAQTLQITGTFSTTPAAWTVELYMRLLPTDDWLIFDTGITVSVTGAYVAVWTVPMSADDTLSLSPSLNDYEFWRVDVGYETVLSSGTQLVLST